MNGTEIHFSLGKVFKNLVPPCEVVLQKCVVQENIQTLVTGNFQKFKPEILVEWKAPLGPEKLKRRPFKWILIGRAGGGVGEVGPWPGCSGNIMFNYAGGYAMLS